MIPHFQISCPGLIINIYVFYKLMTRHVQLSGFQKLCIVKAIPNTIVCFTFLVWSTPLCAMWVGNKANPFTVPELRVQRSDVRSSSQRCECWIWTGRRLGSLYSRWVWLVVLFVFPWTENIITWSSQFQKSLSFLNSLISGPILQVCMSFNRFYVLYFPMQSMKISQFPVTNIAIIVALMIAVVYTVIGLPGKFFFQDHISWLTPRPVRVCLRSRHPFMASGRLSVCIKACWFHILLYSRIGNHVQLAKFRDISEVSL